MLVLDMLEAGENSADVKIKEANSVITYLIHPEKRDTLYSGSRMILNRSSKMAFIPIGLSELSDYLYIQTLGSQHPSLLWWSDIIEIATDHNPLLVAEDVDTIDCFFTGMFRKFVEDYEISVELIRSDWSLERKNVFMKSWWDLIAEDFQKIFRDVVDGLLFLYSLGMPSGGLNGHIYVSRYKHGRILPRMNKLETYENDIEDLIHIMIDVIYLPCLQLGAKRESDYLPQELKHFLSFVKKEKLSHVSAAWLLDQPYFWCSTKRVKFMRKFQKCVQNSSIEYSTVDGVVQCMMDQEFGANTLWFDYLDDPVLVKIRDAGKKGGIIEEYSQNGDIVRFFDDVCSYANELCGPNRMPVENGVFEKIFRSNFPRIYTCLVNLIFDCVEGNKFERDSLEKRLEWFLSSSDV